MMADDGSESSEAGSTKQAGQMSVNDDNDATVQNSSYGKSSLEFTINDDNDQESDATFEDSTKISSSSEAPDEAPSSTGLVRNGSTSRTDNPVDEVQNGTMPISAVEPETPSDEDLIKEAEAWYGVQCYFQASKCLKCVRDRSKLSTSHLNIISVADTAQVCMQECMLPTNDDVLKQNGWIKQTEVHKSHFENTVIHYKINYRDYSLTSRIESVIESKLLLPLIAVLNESDLYATWMPQYTFPFRMGVSESIKLGEYGRGNQIISVKVKLPYPLSDRQVIQHAIAIDAIDDNNAILVRLNTLGPGTYYENTIIEESAKGVQRIDLEASFLIRACPTDHPLLTHRKAKTQSNHKDVSNTTSDSTNPNNIDASCQDDIQGAEPMLPPKDELEINQTVEDVEDVVDVDVNEYNDSALLDSEITSGDNSEKRLDPEGPLLLITLVLQVDSHVTFVPVRVVNFMTRTALAGQWHSLLAVAEDVRTGKRPSIQECILEKQELYGWVEQRVQVMLEKLRNEEQATMATKQQCEPA